METENTFEQFALNRQLLNAVADLSISIPTEIQIKAIPQVLAGHDVIGVAPTGTGKTAAYTLPVLMKIKFAQGEDIRCLVLVPTRELAMQVYKNMTDLAKYTDLRILAIYGGTGTKTQLDTIKAGLDILIATPGRFIEFYLKGNINTKLVNTLIIDEADKMMDMGFMPQLRRILNVIPSKKRQNLLFSATFNEKTEELSAEFLEFPVKIETSPSATPASTIKQIIYETPNFKAKTDLLIHLCKDEESYNRVIVFVRTKKIADDLFKTLTEKLTDKIRLIHSNKDQNSRINAMEDFKAGEIRFLITTDVSARGIDVTMVSHVFNFDVPIVYEDYVHRIGRTGRANNEGTAITFVSPSDKYHLKKVFKLIKTSIKPLKLPKDIFIEETPFGEHQEMAREIDRQKKLEDPTYKGAFHERKSAEKNGYKRLSYWAKDKFKERNSEAAQKRRAKGK
jgi:ATP-dependent RNA helicase RhlE